MIEVNSPNPLIFRPDRRVRINTVIAANNDLKKVTWYASIVVDLIKSPPVLHKSTAIKTRTTGGNWNLSFATCPR